MGTVRVVQTETTVKDARIYTVEPEDLTRMQELARAYPEHVSSASDGGGEGTAAVAAVEAAASAEATQGPRQKKQTRKSGPRSPVPVPVPSTVVLNREDATALLSSSGGARHPGVIVIQGPLTSRGRSVRAPARLRDYTSP